MKRLIKTVSFFMAAAAAASFCACTTSLSEDGGTEVDAGLDAETPDGSWDTGTADAGDGGTPGDSGEIPDASPDSETPDASADSGIDAGNPYAGPPWYGCTGNPAPVGSTTVTVFDRAEQYFSPTDKRTVDANAQFPESGSWENIIMVLKLECLATGMCDPWDRVASVSLIERPGEADEGAIELERYITPFATGLCFETDVTRFASMLKGRKTIRSFIDTWIGGGKGWRVSLSFIFEQGIPAGGVPKVVNLAGPVYAVVGDPANPVQPQLAVPDVQISEVFSYAEVRAIITGHGQGNLKNCGEFCDLGNRLWVNGKGGDRLHVWRTDCAENPTGEKQKGTWQYNRNGWCPGAYVTTRYDNVTPWLLTGEPNKFQADVVRSDDTVYENTCRPGQGGPDNTCTGCPFSSEKGNCDYNGGDHTQPVIRTTYQLFIYP